MIIPAVFYIVWDILFTKEGVWSFNENYITGIKIYNLPIEEVLFFFVVPYCCVFIYECVRCYFPKLQTTTTSKRIFILMSVLLLLIAALNQNKSYTFVTFILTATFLFTYVFKKRYHSFNISAFLVSYLIILIPFLIINGLLTAIPVVLYNNQENLGIRLYTIPVEDIFYGMLLVMMNVAGLERGRA